MQNNLLSARVADLCQLTYKTSAPHYMGFLTETESALCAEILSRSDERYCIFGGFDGAQRKMLCVFPDWCSEPDFPISAITFTYRNEYKLLHKDFLGSLMALGITRESVGDILVESGRAVAFVRDSVVRFILTNMNKIGRVGVDLKIGYAEPLPASGELTACTATVSSMRLDCVISALCGISRNNALEYIASARVLLNSLPVQKPTRTVYDGDSVTVRGKGKFYIAKSDEYSKKGRIILNYNKFK